MNSDLNITGKIARTFLGNQSVTILIIVFLFFLGILSFVITPKEENPQIIVPAAYVVTKWEGASALEVEKRITEPLEDKIKDIDGVEDVYSVTSNSMSMITVKFFVGEPKEISFKKLSNKLNANKYLIPQDASFPIIKPIDIDDVAIMVFAFTSDVYSLETLRDIAQDVGDKLKIIEGTSNIEVIGGQDRRINIYLDPLKMESYDITISEIVNVVKRNNISSPLGDIELSTENYKVTFDNQYKNIEEIKNQVITIKGDRQIILEDIAFVEDGYQNVESYTQFISENNVNSKQAVFLSIAKKKGENAVNISEKIIDKIEELKQNYIVEGVGINITRNSGEVAWDAVASLLNNLWQAVLIVILVLFIFLGIKESLIVAIVIPLTLASVFGLGMLFGQSINRITLFALILSLGMLVDSSIVIVENISRHLDKGDKPKIQLIIDAVNEVGWGLIASTMTTIFAFYPMAFISGMMGPYMAPIPFNTPNALITSMLLSFIVTPWLAFKILKGKTEKKTGEANIEKKEKSSKFNEYYYQILKKLLYSPYLSKLFLSVVSIIFILVMIFPIAPILVNAFDSPSFLRWIPGLEFKMLPKSDKNSLHVFIDLPFGSNIDETKKIVNKLEFKLIKDENISNISSFIGRSAIVDFNGLLKGSNNRNQDNQATIAINLVDKYERNITSKEIVWDLRSELKDFVKNNNVSLKFIEDPPGPPVRSTVLAGIFGDDFEEVDRVNSQIKNIFIQTSFVEDADTSILDNQIEYKITLNREKANLLGVDISELINNLSVIIDGFSPTIYHQEEENDEVKIWIQADPSKVKGINYIDQLTVKTYYGENVPLSEVVSIDFAEEDKPIYHENQRRVSYVFAEMEKRSPIYAIFEIMKEIRSKVDLGNTKIKWLGEWKLTLEVFRDLGLAMAVGVFIIYFILVAQFRSFKLPLLILGTIPLAMIGIIPGFILVNLQFNATSMIGTIALAGIVVNNAIIMLEYILELKNKGQSIEDTVSEAAKTRMRPILLTSATTILGSLTIALGDEVWAGLGWAIIWGMIISSALTLFVFPIIYTMSEREGWRV